MRNFSLTLMIIFIHITSHAQQGERTIYGYVKDSLTGEPLIGVAITADSNNVATTNTYGFYSFNSSAKSIGVNFRYLGYLTQNKTIKLNADISLDILLSSSAIEIEEVIIRPELPKFSEMQSYGSITVNSKQLKYVPSFLGEQDIFKYFQLQPGIVSGKEGSSGMNIRGGSSDQTLILMDDIPIYNHSHAFGFVSIFNGEFIKSAELHKGYIPSNYGGRLSGVATMNMREGNRNEHKQVIQVGLITATAMLEGPINGGKGSYLIGGRYFMPDLILRAISLSNSGTMNANIGFYDITAKVSYDLGDKNTIYANFYTGRDAIEALSKYEGVDDEGVKYKTKSATGLNWGNIVGSLRLSSQLNNKLFLNTTAYYSFLANEKNSSYTDYLTDAGQHSTTQSQMYEVGVKMLFQQNTNSWYNLSYGLTVASQQFTPQEIFTQRDNITSSREYGNRSLLSGTAFLDNKFTFDKFEFNVGGRVSLFNNNKERVVAVEPRVSLNYKMPQSALWLGYTQNVQPLFSINQYYYSLPIDYWVPFQDSNELPSSKQLALGYKYDFTSGLELSAELYYKRSDNLSLVYNIDDFLLGEGGYNLATGSAYGAETMIQYQKGRFNFMGSYTYSRSLHDVNNQTVDFIYDTPHNLNLLGSYETFRKKDKKHTLSINVNYKTGVPYMIANEFYPMEDPFGSSDSEYYNDSEYNSSEYVGDNSLIPNNPSYANKRLSNFFRVDLNYSMEKRLKKGSRVWQVSILNATAYKNPYYIYHKGNGKYKALSLIPFLPSFSYKRSF